MCVQILHMYISPNPSAENYQYFHVIFNFFSFIRMMIRIQGMMGDLLSKNIYVNIYVYI
jgi:hypothetical protein